MHGEEGSIDLSGGQLIKRLLVMVGVSAGLGILGSRLGLAYTQAVSCSVFLAIILGTLFFWNFRLAIAFIGLSILIGTNSLNIASFIQSSSLEVILFLVGMMIIVGALRDLGFFTWIVQLIVSMPNISGRKFIAVTAVASALLACAVDEVTSIIFISTLIFQVCDRLKLNPAPYILICVLCTNVGSAGTMMGNPVGIYIGTKGGLTFGDFMIWAFPIMLMALAATTALTMFYYRKDLKEFDTCLKDRLSRDLSLVPKVKVPYKQGLLLLGVTIAIIASHHQLEIFLKLGKNSILLIAPLVCSGVVMIIKRDRARYYVEREVDWWTLLFFMLLFAIAGTLEHTHVDQVMATQFSKICGTGLGALVPFILAVTAVGSAFVDNVIFVAAFCPVIEKLSMTVKDLPLWWALLFGACFGGNITMIGSTANIVALGMLEKRSHIHMKFLQWLKIGLLSSIIAGGIAWGMLMLLSPLMPDRYAPVEFKDFKENLAKRFKDKNVVLKAELGEELIKKPDFVAVKLFKPGTRNGHQKFIVAFIPVNSEAGKNWQKTAEAKDKVFEIRGKATYSPDTQSPYQVKINVQTIAEAGSSEHH
jgi:Na+/H+ antiporter NhaD/arsenite permease-like protein